MPPSELLKQTHAELCPNLNINSLEFTNILINEILKYKNEIRGSDLKGWNKKNRSNIK